MTPPVRRDLWDWATTVRTTTNEVIFCLQLVLVTQQQVTINKAKIPKQPNKTLTKQRGTVGGGKGGEPATGLQEIRFKPAEKPKKIPYQDKREARLGIDIRQKLPTVGATYPSSARHLSLKVRLLVLGYFAGSCEVAPDCYRPSEGLAAIFPLLPPSLLGGRGQATVYWHRGSAFTPPAG